MTRSELVEKGIELFNHAVAMTRGENAIYFGNEEMREINQFGLDLFLAEQKREAGCAACNNKSNRCFVCKKYKTCNGRMRDGKCTARDYSFESDAFCKYCGRDLTEGESV